MIEFEWEYGAVARLSAFLDGYPDWMNITAWPVIDAR